MEESILRMLMKLRVKPLFHNYRAVFSCHTGHSPSDSWFGVARCTRAIHLLPPVFCCYPGLHLPVLSASPQMALGLLRPKAHLNTISRGPESKLGQGSPCRASQINKGAGVGTKMLAAAEVGCWLHPSSSPLSQ